MLDAGGQPRIDTEKPAVYTQHAFTHWHGKVLLQLIYQIWLRRGKEPVYSIYTAAAG